MAGSFTVQLLGDDGGTPRLVAVNAAGELITEGASSSGLPLLEFEFETTLTNGAATAFADIDLLPTMKLCPDLDAGQVAQLRADYRLISLVISTKDAGQPLELSRNAALGAAGHKVELSTAAGITSIPMSYSGATTATRIGVATTGAAVDYQIQIKFAVAAT